MYAPCQAQRLSLKISRFVVAAYIVTLTEFEKNGYRELLTYMRKNMRFRSKMEPLNTITDPDRLLSVFEACTSIRFFQRQR